MHFLITPRRHLGVALTKEAVRRAVPIKGDVHIDEKADQALGRSTLTATVFNTSPSQPDKLPRLLDASVTGMGTLGLNITGIEQIGDAFYFQSWWCRFE